MKKRAGALAGGVCAAALLLTSCGTAVREALTDIHPAGTTDNDVSGTDYVLYAENAQWAFWFNEDTTAFRVVSKADGYAWSSANPEGQTDTGENAALTLTYLKSGGLLDTMDTMSDAVARGQYTVDRTESGASVVYSVGNFADRLHLPVALPAERFQTLCAGIDDEFARGKFESAYHLVEIEKYTDGADKKALLAQYPRLAEMPLYILTDFVLESASQRQELALVLSGAGYDDEQYRADQAYFQAAEDEADEPGFRVQIDYALDDGGLRVTVPAAGIQMKPQYPLLRLDVLPYFGSPAKTETGYFVLPDGSGSLMRFYNGKGSLQPYTVSLYGMDRSMAQAERIYNTAPAHLPLYGIRSGGHAVLATIEEGAAIADINAYPGGGDLLPYVHAAFRVRESYQSKLQSGNAKDNETFMIVQEQRYTGDIRLCYRFLSGEDADYNGMARLYRSQLFAEREALATGAPPLVVEMLGQVQRQAQFMGVSYSEKVAMTTFAQAQELTGALLADGVQRLDVRLSGWFGGGYGHTYAGRAQPEGRLGGADGLRALAAYLKEKGVGFYPDADIQYTYATGAFDGFSPKRDSAILITQAMGRAFDYNPATFRRDPTLRHTRYIHSPATVEACFTALRSQLEPYGIGGVSLRWAGAEVNTDFRAEAPVDRGAAADRLGALLRQAAGEGLSLMTSGANAAVLPAVDVCLDVPLTSNRMDITDESIPFLPMVLSGYIRYSGGALNLSGSRRSTLLDSAAAGAGLYYVVSAAQDDAVRQTANAGFYCSDFTYLRQEIAQTVTAYQRDLAAVAGRPIHAYERLSAAVSVTRYADGTAVYVNDGDTPATAEGVTIGPMTYVVKGAAA